MSERFRSKGVEEVSQPHVKKYMVMQPGKAMREFERSEEAVRHLIEHHGFAKLYAPDGNLLMTKGFPPADA